MNIRSPIALALALSCSLSLTATGASAHGLSGTPAVTKSAAPFSDVQNVGSRGRNTALGIAAIVGTAIILSEAARADGHRRYNRGSYCGRLLYDCEDGSRRSCNRYEDRCM